MDRVLNPKDEKQTIYEIYRGCRLCGAGAGYKMPIIQNIVDLDEDGIELRQKIKECVQIEVNHTDRMPPLICELCVDKVNEFYEFLGMCKQTNKRTRIRLGLPLQTRTRDSVDSESCILGVTEPVFVDSDSETQNRHKSKKARMKREVPDAKLKTEHRPSPKPEQKRRTRVSRESSEEPRWANTSRSRKAPSPIPKRMTRQNVDVIIPPIEDPLVIEKRLKRPRETETKDMPPPSKKVKIAPEPVKEPKPGPKSSKTTQKEPIKSTPKSPPKTVLKKEPPPKTTPSSKPSKATPSKPLPSKATPSKPIPSKATPSKPVPSKATPSKPVPSKATPSKPLPSKATPSKGTPSSTPKPFYCLICKLQTKSSQGFAQHNTKHLPNFTSPKHACNACELWFPTLDEASSHHRAHRLDNTPYKCSRCYGYFRQQQAYEDHFGLQQCLSVYEVPDSKCWECWRSFPTTKLMEEHRCAGEDARPGGKCAKCKRSYALLKNLVKHESSCNYKKKGEVAVDPSVRSRLLPMQVKVARCDRLINAKVHVNASTVPHNYGLDSNSYYPYLTHIQVKPEPPTQPHPMVIIEERVKEEFDYVNWDSDASDDSADTDSCQKQVQSLSSLSLKTIFSERCIGKVPRRKRKLKSNINLDLCRKIDDILNNLNAEDAFCSDDSNSILVKNHDAKNRSKNISVVNIDSQVNYDSDSVLDKVNVEGAAVQVEKFEAGDDTSVKQDDTSEKQDDTLEKQDDTSEKQDDTSEKKDEMPKKMDACEIKVEISEQNNDTCEEKDEILEQMDETSDKRVATSEKCDDTSDRSVNTEILSADNISEASEKINGSINENDEESAKETEDMSDSLADYDESINNVSVNASVTEKMLDDIKENDDKSVNNDIMTNNNDLGRNDDENEQIDSKNDDSKEVDTLETEKDTLINEKDSKNDDLDSVNQNQCENKLVKSNVSDVQMNDSDKNNVDHKNSIKNDAASHEKSENNESFSKIDEITRRILDQSQNSDELPKGYDDNEETLQNDDYHQNSEHSVPINRNCVKNQDKFNVDDLNEADRLLMEELDAQIGENNQTVTENNQTPTENNQTPTENNQTPTENNQTPTEHNQTPTENNQTPTENDQTPTENDQFPSGNEHQNGEIKKKEHPIDNLRRKQDNDLRSLDLDSISDDEFNFDAL